MAGGRHDHRIAKRIDAPTRTQLQCHVGEGACSESHGTGLSKLIGKIVRIGHLGSFNDLMLAGTLSGIEMGLRLAGVPHQSGGVMAALHSLAPAVYEPAHSASA